MATTCTVAVRMPVMTSGQRQRAARHAAITWRVLMPIARAASRTSAVDPRKPTKVLVRIGGMAKTASAIVVARVAEADRRDREEGEQRQGRDRPG